MSRNSGRTVGQLLADVIAKNIGSWKFITIQTALLCAWIVYNVHGIEPPDPWPFVFLNLLLSFQAAYTGPILLMASNRQTYIDRKRSIEDLNINKQNNEILEKLSQKLDAIAEKNS
jgi:uncharacterized membrane protein